MHIKKSKMPREWPLAKKGSTFLAVPSHAKSKGISLLFILRDILKLARTRKEVRYMTLNGLVKVNSIERKNENFPVQVFDTINLSPKDKLGNPGKVSLNYKLEIVNRKFSLKKVTDKEAETKIVKITGKKIISGGEIQMNLADGQNILTKEKFSLGDSVILNNLKKSIVKVLPLKIGATVEIIRGKHAGKTGKLLEFSELVRGKDYVIKLNDREVSLPYKTILVIA